MLGRGPPSSDDANFCTTEGGNVKEASPFPHRESLSASQAGPGSAKQPGFLLILDAWSWMYWVRSSSAMVVEEG